jgi:hypothetical protein
MTLKTTVGSLYHGSVDRGHDRALNPVLLGPDPKTRRDTSWLAAGGTQQKSVSGSRPASEALVTEDRDLQVAKASVRES